jgi:hypothetical protein
MTLMPLSLHTTYRLLRPLSATLERLTAMAAPLGQETALAGSADSAELAPVLPALDVADTLV